jgi:hypothetical protein
MSNKYCVVFLFLFCFILFLFLFLLLLSCLTYIANFSRCQFLIAPSIFSNVYFQQYQKNEQNNLTPQVIEHSSTNTTNRHDITEILLKVSLSTIATLHLLLWTIK